MPQSLPGLSGVVHVFVGEASVTADVYRRHAADCLALADQTADETQRMKLIGMAQSWFRLAEQAEKNSHNDVVYEHDPRPPGR